MTVYVSLPQVGDSVTAGDTCGELESTKSVSDLYSPLDGEVTTVLSPLDDATEATQRRHHLLGRRGVGGGVHRQDDGIRNLARGEPQRHTGAHPEGTRLVARRGDDRTLRGVAAAPDEEFAALAQAEAELT